MRTQPATRDNSLGTSGPSLHPELPEKKAPSSVSAAEGKSINVRLNGHTWLSLPNPKERAFRARTP